MKIIRYFSDVDMRNGHNGLRQIARDEGIDLRRVPEGQFVIFMNKKKNCLKMFASYNVLAHVKLDEGKIDPRVIAHIPACFNGREIDYDKALRKVMRREFPKYEWV